MATDTRSGFRLPWAAAENETQDPTATHDAPVSEEAQDPDMIETAETAETAKTAEIADTATVTSEATDDAETGETEAGTAQPARRATKFMAELSRAMQAAAESARSETMARFEVEAKGVVEEIRAAATDEAADLRRTADDDVAAIREWSKAEIARIREETEGRIAARKSGLDGEMEQHAATVEARIERVSAVVAAFETQMAGFFERLNAEEDPTRIATMAETMPEPPSLADVAASVARQVPALPPAAEDEAAVEPSVAAEPATPAAYDFAAAEAEAASFSGDLAGEPDLPEPEATADGATEDAQAGADDALDVEPSSADLATSRVVVSGLVSVANIANFKRSLARTPGVATIAVASGPDGDFVFTVGHTLGAALTVCIQALPGFDIEVTSETDDAINVAARDRDADG